MNGLFFILFGTKAQEGSTTTQEGNQRPEAADQRQKDDHQPYRNAARTHIGRLERRDGKRTRRCERGQTGGRRLRLKSRLEGWIKRRRGYQRGRGRRLDDLETRSWRKRNQRGVNPTDITGNALIFDLDPIAAGRTPQSRGCLPRQQNTDGRILIRAGAPSNINLLWICNRHHRARR